MATLINMKMDAEEVKEQTNPTAQDAPKYPWGLCITLNDDTLEKLGIDKLPEVNTEVRIVAKAEVTSVRTWQTQGGEDESTVELQITDMQVSGMDTGTGAMLYDKSK